VFANGVHAGTGDEPRCRRLVSFGALIVKRDDPSGPRLHEIGVLPGIHATLKSFVTNREILRTMIERSAVLVAACGHAPTHTAALLEHGHRNVVVGQSPSASQTGDACTDHRHGGLKSALQAVGLHDSRPDINGSGRPLPTDSVEVAITI
jgi:hypothetical protein